MRRFDLASLGEVESRILRYLERLPPHHASRRAHHLADFAIQVARDIKDREANCLYCGESKRDLSESIEQWKLQVESGRITSPDSAFRNDLCCECFDHWRASMTRDLCFEFFALAKSRWAENAILD